jgi:hypothetical protein
MIPLIHQSGSLGKIAIPHMTILFEIEEAG